MTLLAATKCLIAEGQQSSDRPGHTSFIILSPLPPFLPTMSYGSAISRTLALLHQLRDLTPEQVGAHAFRDIYNEYCTYQKVLWKIRRARELLRDGERLTAEQRTYCEQQLVIMLQMAEEIENTARVLTALLIPGADSDP